MKNKAIAAALRMAMPNLRKDFLCLAAVFTGVPLPASVKSIASQRL